MSAHDTLSQRTVTEVEDIIDSQIELSALVCDQSNVEGIEPEEVILDLVEQSEIVGKEYCFICCELQSKLIKTPCNHSACPKCWQTWLRKALDDRLYARIAMNQNIISVDGEELLKVRCPFCRTDLWNEETFLENTEIDIGIDYYRAKYPQCRFVE